MTAPDVRVETPAAPLVEGLPEALEVAVRAPTGRAVLLESVVLESTGPSGERETHGSESWRRRPNGLVLYDAQADRYAHLTVTQAVASVPIHTGVLPPEHAATAFVACRVLTARTSTVDVVVRYREVEPTELAARLYLSRDERGIRSSPQIYKLGRERAADVLRIPPSSAIVREEGLSLLEHRASVALTVVEDPTSPSRAAAELGPVVGRCSALGAAWLVRAPEGRVLVRLASGDVVLAAELAVFDALDELRGAGLRALFRGPRASRVCEALQGESGDTIPALVAPERLAELVRLAAREGVSLRVGRPWEGVVIET